MLTGDNLLCNALTKHKPITISTDHINGSAHCTTLAEYVATFWSSGLDLFYWALPHNQMPDRIDAATEDGTRQGYAGFGQGSGALAAAA